jgi:hypothetical protein
VTSEPVWRCGDNIAISQAAYEAIGRTLVLRTVACEPQPNENGERLIWLEERRLDKLNSIRRSGESYSEAIIRLATLWEGQDTQTTLSKLSARATRARTTAT